MKLISSLNPNTDAAWARCGCGRASSAGTFRCGFELCVIAHDASEAGVCSALNATGQSLLINLPAIISSSDLKRAKAATESSWYVLSGRHHTSTLLLTLKAEAVDCTHAALDRVLRRGDQVAILLDGEIKGVLVFQNSLNGSEIAIDASFFSDGTEKEKELETRRLAQQINSTLF